MVWHGGWLIHYVPGNNYNDYISTHSVVRVNDSVLSFYRSRSTSCAGGTFISLDDVNLGFEAYGADFSPSLGA